VLAVEISVEMEERRFLVGTEEEIEKGNAKKEKILCKRNITK
jgi:hypothetical protein